MLNRIFRNLCSGLLCIGVALSQSATAASTAIAQTDDPLPKPTLSFDTNRGPWAPSIAVPEPAHTPSITPTAELRPEELVRDITARGRAILYPGHVFTPTETTESAPINQAAPAGDKHESNRTRTTISGTVIAGDSGLPIIYVRVIGYDLYGFFDSALTDRQGKFSLSGDVTNPISIRIDPSQIYPYDLAGEWYDDQPLSNTATLISNTVDGPPILVSLNRGSQITGTIVASDTGAPLAGMTLAVYDANGTFLHSVLSDDAGRYTTGGLRTGSYTMCAFAYQEADAATRKHYPGGCYNHQATPATGTPLTVTAPTLLTDITVTVPIASQITGVVTAADSGAPLAGVEVDVFALNRTYGNYTVTNSNGQYVLDGLLAGPYQIYFSTGYRTVTDTEVHSYIGEYYNDKHYPADGDVITLTTSSVLSNINASLDRLGSITGVVTAEDTGMPLSDVKVTPIGPTDYYASVTTTVRGEYTLSNLPAGFYKLYFSTSHTSVSNTRQYFEQYYDGQTSLNAANSVSVTLNHTTGGINVSLDRGGQITGVVTAKDSGLGLDRVLVYVNRHHMPGETYLDFSSVYTLTDSSGHYTVTAPGGLNDVSFLPFYDVAPYCGQVYNQHAAYWEADAVSVVPKQVTANINATLDHVSSISGTVTSEDKGAPLNRVTVRLRALRQSGYNYYDYIYDETDARGRYSLGPLCAGHYTLQFDPTYGPTQTALYAPNFYNQKPTFETSDAIHLASGVSLTINSALTLPATVTGTVIAADTGQPIVNSYVIALDSTGKTVQSISDSNVYADGTYTLKLTSGRYKLYVIAHYFYYPFFTRYANEYYSGTSSFSEAAVLELAPGQMLGNINFVLQHGGVITGQVTDKQTGEPILNALVDLFDTSNPNLIVARYGTDENGVYTMPDQLRTGTYKARVSKSDYLSTYYGGSLDFNSASPISVTNGVTTTQINVQLLSIQSPNLQSRLRFPILLRQASQIPSIASTPFVVPRVIPTPTDYFN